MLEKLGKRAIAAPFMPPLLICLILGLAMTPILRAQMTEVPFAVVSLDEGSELPFTDVNVGDELVGRLLDGESLGDAGDDADDSDDAMDGATIAWTEFQTEDEARAALAANEYYGAIVIPEDFTAQQMRSATGLGGAPTLTVLLNTAKNPSLAQQMGPNLKSMMIRAGISVDVEEVNAADIGGGSMAPMMAVQMMAMPLVIMSLIGSILMSVVLWPRNGATRRARAVALLKQLVACVVLSGIVALLGTGIDVWFGGLDLPMDRLFPFVWFAVGALIAALVSLCDLALPLGALAGVTTFALGMSCAMLAPEMLPPFWQEWVYPWVPQHYLGDGIRGIIYLGAGSFDMNFEYWRTYYIIAAVALLLALAVPQRAHEEGESPLEARKQKMAAMKEARRRKAAALREARERKARARKASHARRTDEVDAPAGVEGGDR